MAAAPDITQGLTQTLSQLTPIGAIVAGAVITVLLDLRKNINLRAFLPFVALMALLMAISSLWSQLGTVPQGGLQVAFGSLRIDGFSLWASVVIALGAGFAVLSVAGREGEPAPNTSTHAVRHPPPAEFYALLLTATAGAMLLTMADDLLTALVAIETLSIPTYVLCASDPLRRTAAESGMKYFVMGAFSSGFLIFGIVFFYGATGSLSLSPAKWLTLDPLYATMFLPTGDAAGSHLGATPFFFYAALALMLVGFVFKIGGVPFQQWVPDVYAGAPTPVTNFMSTVVKAAAFAFLMRMAATAMSTSTLDSLAQQILELRTAGRVAPLSMADAAHLQTLVLQRSNLLSLITGWQNILAVLAGATMILGNAVALVQTNIKRMLAYSAIAHTGYLLMGVIATVNKDINTDHAATAHVTQGVAFYLLSYALSAGGAFGIIALVRASGRELNTLDDFRGLAKERPGTALAMTFFMLSMAGFPPLGGFFGKFLVFRSAINAGWSHLAVLAIITSIISVYYYLGPVVKMYMKQPPGLEPDPFAPVDEHGHTPAAPTTVTDPMAEPAWGSSVLIAFCAVGIVMAGLFAQVILDRMVSL